MSGRWIVYLAPLIGRHRVFCESIPKRKKTRQRFSYDAALASRAILIFFFSSVRSKDFTT